MIAPHYCSLTCHSACSLDDLLCTSQVLAFTLPTSVLRGRFCIRPDADEALINNPVFVQLLPLLSPVLPVQLDDNDFTRSLDHQVLHVPRTLIQLS